MYKNDLIRKIRLILKFTTSPWFTNNCNTHIARKGNQAMKFGQLINMRNIFVEKSYTKCAGETIPRPLSKKSKLSISLDKWCKVLNSWFLLYDNLRTIEI